MLGRHGHGAGTGGGSAHRLAALLLAVLLTAALHSGCSRDESQALPTGPRFLNQAADVAYVGVAACASCHVEITSSYRHTGMGRSFFPMTPEVANEDFSMSSEIALAAAGLRYRMVERDGRYFQRQWAVTPAGQEIAVDEREMVYVLGSGNHSRSYVTVEDGKLLQMPMCWYPQEQRWDLCPGFDARNEHFTREIEPLCVFCHNARMERVEGTDNQYQEPIPAGINCERCHGPGQLHVEKWRSGREEPTGELDATIVNPRRLPTDLRVQVCFQCHMGDSHSTQWVIRPGRRLEDWRPGQPLGEALIQLHYAEALDSKFGISAQADRMILSRCFTESGGRLECLTCHNPHVTVYREDRPEDLFTRRCRQCHGNDGCTAPTSARQATTPADDCVACHMRRAEPDDHPHTTFTDHWIRRDIRPSGRLQRGDHTLKPMIPAAFAALDPGEQEFVLGQGYLHASLRTDGPERAELRRRAGEHLQAAVAAGFDGAETWFAIGDNASYAQRWPEAADAFRRAVERDPDHPQAARRLAEALVQLNQFREAAAVYDGILRGNSGDAVALADAGRLSLNFGRPEEALRLLDMAVSRKPWRPPFHANRGMALAELGRADAALRAVERAARLNPQDPAIWSYYAALLEEAGARESPAARAHADRLVQQAPAATAP